MAVVQNANTDEIRLGPGALFIDRTRTAPEPTNLTTALDPAWVGLGYTEEGSSFSVSITAEGVEVAEELEPVLYPVSRREMSLSFALAQVTAENLSIAMNGGDIVASDVTRSIGTGTIVAATGVITTSAPHGLVVGDRAKVGTSNGVTAGTIYYVKTAPSSTTLTLSATAGGTVVLGSSDGSVGTVVEVEDRIVTFNPPEVEDSDNRVSLLWISDDESELWIYRKCLQTGTVEMARRKTPTKTTIPMEFRVEKEFGVKPYTAIFRASSEL